MKKVTLVGNLTKDIELRTVKVDGKDVFVATITVACNDGEKATFIDVEVWRTIAENAAKYLAKGSSVAIEADIVQRIMDYTAFVDGKEVPKKMYSYKFIAESVEYLSGKKKSE